MTTTIANPATQKMSGKEIVDLARKHTLYEWSAQSKVDPIPVAHAKGIYFYTPEGKRFIDFNSQLMSVNIGHGDERVIQAISEQAATLAYANPFMATEARARGWARSLPKLRPATSTRSSLRMVAPTLTRMLLRLRASSPDATRLWRAIALITARLPARSVLPAIRADGLLSLAFRVWCTYSILITASNADGNRQSLRWP